MSGSCWAADSPAAPASYTPVSMRRHPHYGDPDWCSEKEDQHEPCPPGQCRSRGVLEPRCPVPGDRPWPLETLRLWDSPPRLRDADRAKREAAYDDLFRKLEDFVAFLRNRAENDVILASEVAELDDLQRWLGRLYVEGIERRRAPPAP